MNENIKKEINWKLGSGKKASVKIELILSERIWADGDEIIIPKCDIKISAEAEGMGSLGHGRPMEPVAAAKKAVPGCAGMIGKLVIMPENMEKINVAIAELEAHPAWIAKIEKQKLAEIENEKYEAHRAKMKKVMGY